MNMRKNVDNITTIGVGIGLAYLIGYGSYKLFHKEKLDFPDKNIIFESTDYEKEYVNYFFIDIDGDNIPDYVAVSYDFDKNKIPDVSAFYVITNIDSKGNVESSSIARLVVVDKNEDGIPDYILMDEDNNGTLEKKVINGTKLKNKRT